MSTASGHSKSNEEKWVAVLIKTSPVIAIAEAQWVKALAALRLTDYLNPPLKPTWWSEKTNSP